MLLQYLNWKGLRWTNKGFAKTFYHREDAEGALSVMKIKDAKKSD